MNHIPRCGGSSIRKSFYDAYKNHKYFGKCPAYISEYTHNNISLYHNPELIIAIHPKTTIFIDHSYSLFIENNFNLPIHETYRILTIRNPIDRILSHMFYFYKQDIDNLSKIVVNKFIADFGNLTIDYLTKYKYTTESLKTRFNKARKELESYNFIFKTEEQILIEDFNTNNPFELHLENNHIQRTKIEYRKNISKKVIDHIKQNIPLEIKLLENYYVDI